MSAPSTGAPASKAWTISIPSAAARAPICRSGATLTLDSARCTSRTSTAIPLPIVSATALTARPASPSRSSEATSRARPLAMALTATIHHFTIRLSDVDRGVYETLELKAAKHPSESDEYLVTRVLAYCLEYAEGIAFSRGLAEPDEPAQLLRSLERERIHRAEALELYSLGRGLVAALVGRLARRNDLDMSVTDRHLYVTIGGETLSG